MTKALLVSLLAAAVIAGCGQSPGNSAATQADAQKSASSKPAISDAWAAATAEGVKVSAGYMVVANATGGEDKIIAASMPKAGVTEVHLMIEENGVMKMRKADAGVPVVAGGQVEFAPGGAHLMFMDLKEPLNVGDTVPVTVTFEKAGPITVNFSVKPRSAAGMAPDHKR